MLRVFQQWEGKPDRGPSGHANAGKQPWDRLYSNL
jgi:hypothetical protein